MNGLASGKTGRILVGFSGIAQRSRRVTPAQTADALQALMLEYHTRMGSEQVEALRAAIDYFRGQVRDDRLVALRERGR